MIENNPQLRLATSSLVPRKSSLNLALGGMPKRFPISVVLVFVLLGCSSNTPRQPPGILTVAVVGEIVLVGRAYPAGTAGTFSLQALEQAMECSGSYRYLTFPNGRARYSCSDGTSGSMRIVADSQLSGGGVATTDLGRMHLVYGYGIGRVNSLLSFPGNGKLELKEGQVVLSRMETVNK